MNTNLNYLEILNSLGDGVICINQKKHIIYSNNKATTILDKSLKEILLSSINNLLSIRTDQDGIIIHELIDLVLKTGNASGLKKDSYILDNRGNKKFLSASISKIQVEANEPIIVINFRDITRLITLEQASVDQRNNLEKILDSMPIGIVIVDNHKKVVKKNAYINVHFNHHVDDETLLIGNQLFCENAIDGLCGDKSICKNCELINTLSAMQLGSTTNESIKITMNHYIDHVMRKVDYQITMVSLLEQDNKKTMLIFRDITTQVSYEKSILDARKKAEEANQLKSNFLANMSHEIRTPLNGIIGMIDLTRRHLSDPEMIDNLDIAKKSSNSLLYLINDILDLSKIEANKFVIQKKRFKLNDIFLEIIREHQYQADLKNLKLTYETNIDNQLHVTTDKYRIKQIVNNLIGNSLKFTNKGHVILKSFLNEQHDELVITVDDTGCGIDESFRESLFESFTQADGSYTRQKGGTGLGLAITKQLVKLLDGRINFETNVSEGTRFIVEIPIIHTTELTESVLSPEIRDVNFDNVKGNILLIEDDIVNQIIIRKQLVMDGYHVEIADNGLEGMKLFKLKDYDLIIMDIQMPVMNGLEVIKEIRKVDIVTPVVALTALAIKSEKEEIMAYGFDRYIMKPVEMNHLSDLVSTMICDKRSVAKQEIVHEKVFILKEALLDIDLLLENEEDLNLESKLIFLQNYFDKMDENESKTLVFKALMSIRKFDYDHARVYLNMLKTEGNNA